MSPITSRIVLPGLIGINLLLYCDLLIDPTQPIKTLFLALICFFYNLKLNFHKKRRFSIPFLNPIVILFSIYLIWNVISITYTMNPNQSIQWIALIFLSFNLFLILIHYLSTYKEQIINNLSISLLFIQLILTASIVISILSMDDVLLQGSSKPYGGLIINPNLSSQLLLLLMPFSLNLAFNSKKLILKWTAIISTLLSLGLIIYIASIAVLLATILFTLSSFYLWLYWNHKRTFKKITIASVLVLLIPIFIGLSKIDKLKERESGNHRIELWQRSIRMIECKPLLGFGVGSWAVENLNHIEYDEEDSVNKNYSSIFTTVGNIFYLRPHNDFLWIASETGSIGLVLYLLIISVTLRSLFLNVKFHECSINISLLVFAALISFCFISLLSFPKERIETNILFGIFIAIGVTFSNSKSNIHLTETNSKLLLVFFVVISTFVVYVSSNKLKAEYHLLRLMEAKNQNDWHNVYQEAKAAYHPLNSFSSNGSPIKYYKGLAEFNLELIDQAHKSYHQAYKIHPNHLFVLNDLATTYSILGDIDSAIILYEKAIELNPRYEDAKLNLVSIYFNKGLHDKSWKLINEVPYYSTHPKFKEFSQIIGKHLYKEHIISISKEKGVLEKTLKEMQAYPYYFYRLQLAARKNNKSILTHFCSTLSIR